MYEYYSSKYHTIEAGTIPAAGTGVRVCASIGTRRFTIFFDRLPDDSREDRMWGNINRVVQPIDAILFAKVNVEVYKNEYHHLCWNGGILHTYKKSTYLGNGRNLYYFIVSKYDARSTKIRVDTFCWMMITNSR